MTDLNDEYSNVKTKWSGDLGTLIRIDGLLRQCIIATNTQDYTMWFTALANIYKEAVPHFDANKKVKDNINAIKKSVEAEYNVYLNHVKLYNNLRENDKNRYGFNYTGNIYFMLEQYEIELRLILDKAGLMMKKIERPEYAIS